MSTSAEPRSIRRWLEPLGPHDEEVPARRLRSLSVRELLGQLAASEEALRHLEPPAGPSGRTIPDPARLTLLARQRALVRELRARRPALRGTP